MFNLSIVCTRPHETYTYGINPCGNTCVNYLKKCNMLTLIAINGCDCIPGYARLYVDGECVSVDDIICKMLMGTTTPIPTTTKAPSTTKACSCSSTTKPLTTKTPPTTTKVQTTCSCSTTPKSATQTTLCTTTKSPSGRVVITKE